ncbi:M1 family metallopeptidase [Methylobacter sp.]|uniref:M1 family metallopeptidase n=1 Tax=Methylobacter sp. TaxID=2051955 RepID=UPI003DA6384D
MNRFSILCCVMLACTAFSSLAAVPEIDLSVKINPDINEFSAEALLKLEASEKYIFGLAPGLELDSAEADEVAVLARNIGSDGQPRFELTLPKQFSAHKLRIRYHGRLVKLNPEEHRDTLAPLPPMVSKEGSYLPAGSGWYPEPGAFFSYRLAVQTPAGQIAVAPGTLSREALKGDSRTALFTMDHPVEGIDLMIGPYALKERVISTDTAPIALRTYFHPDIAELADGYLDASKNYLQRYASQIGAYPYSHFSIVSSPLPTGLGMQSLTYLGRDVLKLPFIKATSLGHEILHNWWGNGVFVDTVDGNWSEGLTTFMADYAFKEDEGPEAAKEMRYGWLRDRQAIPPGEERPLSAFQSRHHVASANVGYGKAAMMFLALRDRIGRESFYAALCQFWLQHQFKAAGFKDLRQAFEKSSGKDLSDFFAQWLEQTGASMYSLDSAFFDGKALHLAIGQTLPGNEMRLPVRIYSAKSYEDFFLDLSGQVFKATLAPEAEPLALSIDPDFTVWRALAPEESLPILRDVVAGRRLALLVLNDKLATAALSFTKAFAEGEVEKVSEQQATQDKFVIVLGGSQEVDAWLSRSKLPPRPAVVSGGDIQVWMVNHPARHVLAVSVHDQDDNARSSLEAVGKRLPHLARYAWATFEQGRTRLRGNWPTEPPRYLIKR